MKKVICLTLSVIFFLAANAYALDTRLTDLRDRILDEAKEIKTLANAKYLVLVSSMWDTCFIAVTQLDAYLYMLGIFNTIRKDSLTEATVDFLSNWLKQIRSTNDLNVKGLDAINVPLEPMVRIHLEKVKRNFKDLNTQIDAELEGITRLKKSISKTPPLPAGDNR